MPLVKYRIYELSARAVISYGRQQECAYAFQLSAAETENANHFPRPMSRTITHCSIRLCACCAAMPSPEHPVGSW